MQYDEIGDGGAIPKGCAVISYIRFINALFDIGDVLYNVNAARRGRLEKVVIKAKKIANPAKTQGTDVVLYIDTLNGLWNEDDLVSYSDAQLAIANYLADQEAWEAAMNNC